MCSSFGRVKARPASRPSLLFRSSFRLWIQVQNGPGRPIACIGLDEGESGVVVGQDEGAGVALGRGQVGEVRTCVVKEEGVRPLENVGLAIQGAEQDGVV